MFVVRDQMLQHTCWNIEFYMCFFCTITNLNKLHLILHNAANPKGVSNSISLEVENMAIMAEARVMLPQVVLETNLHASYMENMDTRSLIWSYHFDKEFVPTIPIRQASQTTTCDQGASTFINS